MNYLENVNKKLEKLKNKKDILVLGIESSCDETSISIVKNGREILSNIVSSQIDIHKRFGGVVPEVASRNHVKAINNCLTLCLNEANLTLKDIDLIAVTFGAGLIGALMVLSAFCPEPASLNINKDYNVDDSNRNEIVKSIDEIGPKEDKPELFEKDGKTYRVRVFMERDSLSELDDMKMTSKTQMFF